MSVLGVDIGQARDFAAVALLEPAGRRRSSNGLPCFGVTAAERYPLGTRYADLADDIASIAADLDDAGIAPLVVLDSSGIGRAVVERVRDQAPANCPVVGIATTAGKRIGGQWPDLTVPKHRLVDALLTTLERDGLVLADGLPASDQLSRELSKLRVKTTHSGYQRIEADKASDHDDVAAALMLANWIAADITRREATRR